MNVKYDKLIAEKLQKEDAGWVIRKDQLETEVKEAKDKLAGMIEDWEDGQKVE